jgi:hypothetical protein
MSRAESIEEFRGKLRTYDAKRATKTSSKKGAVVTLLQQGDDFETSAPPMNPETVPGVLIGIIVLLVGMLIRAHHFHD